MRFGNVPGSDLWIAVESSIEHGAKDVVLLISENCGEGLLLATVKIDHRLIPSLVSMLEAARKDVAK